MQREIEELQNDNTNLKKNFTNLTLKFDSIQVDQKQIYFEKDNLLSQLQNEQDINKNLQEKLNITSRLLNDERNEHIESKKV